jgi:hypothetical protein
MQTSPGRVPFFYLFVLLLFSAVICRSQTTAEKKALHPIRKSSLRIIFDDRNATLISIDTAGHVVENAIIAFQLYVRIKGVSYSEQTLGAALSKPMLDLLEKADSNTILYFEHIQVKNEKGKLMEADDFQYTLSYVKKKEKKEKEKKGKN